MKKTNLAITIISIMALASCHKPQHTPSTTFSNADEKYHFRGCKACDDFHFQEEHNWVKGKEEEATCTKEGITVYTCECGARKEDKTEPLGHIPGETYYIDANGHHTVCSRPGCYQSTKEGAHDFKVIDEKKPTCEEDGLKTFECECGLKKTETIEKTGHTPSTDWTANSQIHQKTCKTCGKVIESGVHDFNVQEKESTCTEDGYRHLECSVCGYKSSSTISAKGHDISTTWVKNEEGHYKTCSRCDEHFEASAHNYVNVETKDATCTEEGYIKKECKDCKFEKIETISKVAHTPGEYIDDGDYHIKKCTVCEAVLETKAHEYVNDHKDATCTESGFSKTTCTHCGHALVDTVQDPLGHVFEYESLDADSHTATCSRCGETSNETHTFETREVAATVSNCAQTIKECTVCDYEEITYTGAHFGGHQVTANDQPVEIDEQKCGTVCKIPGCNYVFTQKNHYFATKKILSYPEGDQPGTEAAACVYCFKTREITEFTGTKVDQITVTMPVMPSAGITLQDFWSYTVEEDVAMYASTNDGKRILGLAIEFGDETFYNFNHSMDTVITEEQIASGYTLYFYFKNSSDTYWEWDNENLKPAIEVVLNGQYRGTVNKSTNKMSGYWTFTVTVA
ncbi:MAG: hypothetical protein MJ238_05565 [Bacilli bacterium]|nr:hypothetical protein [Bacilli bacterium]